MGAEIWSTPRPKNLENFISRFFAFFIAKGQRTSKLLIKVKINACYCTYKGFVDFERGWIWR